MYFKSKKLLALLLSCAFFSQFSLTPLVIYADSKVDEIEGDFEMGADDFTPVTINGACGTSNNTATLTSPSTGLCSKGTASAITTAQDTFSWSCSGTGTWATTASCSAPRQYQIIFSGNGGTPSSQSLTRTYNTSIGSIATISTPTQSGYTFTGWYSSATWGTLLNTGSLVLSWAIYYAHWDEIITPPVVTPPVTPPSTSSWGGWGGGGSPITHGVCGTSSDIPTFSAPTTNMCAAGSASSVTIGQDAFIWSCLGSGVGAVTVSCTAPRKYTIKFDPNGGTTPTPYALTGVVYNHEVGPLPTTTQTGYLQKGWFTTQTGTIQATQNTKVIQSETWYAQWAEIGDGVCGTASTLATKIAPTTNLCLSGTPSSVVTHAWSFTWTCAWDTAWQDASCSAQRSYTVTFDPNGGSTPTPPTKDVIYHHPIGDLALTSKSGSTLTGWFDSGTGGTKIQTGTLIEDHMVVYAQWNTVSSGSNPTDPGTPTPPTSGSTPPSDSTPPSWGYYLVPWVNDPARKCEQNLFIEARKCEFANIDISFSDIESSFAKNYIQSLGEAGIVQWYFNTSLFDPRATISRAEYLKVILRAFCIDYSDTITDNIPFTDVDKTSWEAKVIAKALELGAIDASQTHFRPNDSISRGESLKILFNVSWVSPRTATFSRFDDVDESGWEVKYTQTAYDICLVDGYRVDEKLVFKPYNNMKREEVAKIVANALMLGQANK